MPRKVTLMKAAKYFAAFSVLLGIKTKGVEKYENNNR